MLWFVSAFCCRGSFLPTCSMLIWLSIVQVGAIPQLFSASFFFLRTDEGSTRCGCRWRPPWSARPSARTWSTVWWSATTASSASCWWASSAASASASLKSRSFSTWPWRFVALRKRRSSLFFLFSSSSNLARDTLKTCPPFVLRVSF